MSPANWSFKQQQRLTVHDGRPGSQPVGLSLGGTGVQDRTVGVDNGLGEASGSGSEEENGLRVGLGRSETEIFGAALDLSGRLDVIEQLDVQTGGTGLVELTGSDLVGQPDGLDRIGGQEGVQVFDVSLAVVELGGEVGEETGDEASAKSGPDGQHVILVRGQVDDNDGLLASGRGANGGRSKGSHEGVRHGLNRGLEPRNIIELGGSGGGDKGDRPAPVDLGGPCEHLRESVEVR